MNVVCPHCGAQSEHPDGPANASARGVDLPMGAALQAIYAGVDPELAKIDRESRHATRQPEAARQALAALRAKVLAQGIAKTPVSEEKNHG
jgi:hypothetical protein